MTQNTCLIIGAGAVGLLWSAKLASRNTDVHLLYRSHNPGNHIHIEDDASEAGLGDDARDIDDLSGNAILDPVTKVKSLTVDELDYKYDNILICTKSFDLVDAYQSIREFTKKNANIWTLCNGMGMHDELLPHLKSGQKLWAGVTSEGALKINHNTVKRTGSGDTFFGIYKPSDKSNDVETTQPFLEDTIFHSLLVPNITHRMLEKLAVNCVINPITALFEIRNGEVLDEPYKSLAEQCTKELADCYLEAPLQPLISNAASFSFFNLVNRVYTVAQLTRLNHSSMHEDLKFGRKTEIENISGYMIKQATNNLPLQSTLLHAILSPTKREQHKKALLEIATS
ncbi:ketopantoate reductase family protein [Marinomonas mediterranea]|uniref:ketopantoate reductase family protein n=1 Tax=Marinomonas mediterranea TaxID=119864 RepID=UPI00234B561D|nr:2-dehydropantoate 2-reductase [Marinomonas mediterranea]WCN09282.1 2-dehydropantoate 2-reductase [Marinomonas mediterranea]